MSTIKTNTIQPTGSANNLVLKTGAADTERIRITPQGTILIGTQSNPADDATTLFVASKTANNAILARLYNASTENGAYIGLQLNNNANNGYLINYGSGHPLTKIVSLENDTTGNGLLLYSGSTSGPIRFTTAGVERVRIISSGNVGIGTLSPGATLDVNGTLNVSGNITGMVGGLASALLPTGAVLQVVHANYSSSYTVTDSYASTGLSATITPKRSNSKIIILCSLNLLITNAKANGSRTDCKIVSTLNNINTDIKEFKRVIYGSAGNNSDNVGCQSFISAEHSPNTTSDVSYTVHAIKRDTTTSFNYLNYGGSSDSGNSTMILVEVAV